MDPNNPSTGSSSASGNGGFNLGQYGAGFGAIGSGIAGLFNNPYNAANKYLNQIPGYLQQAYGPYMQAGSQLLPQLMSQYGNLASNPGANLAALGSNYQSSPGYQFQVNQATDAANRAAAAGGMIGTQSNQVNNMQIANQLANQNYNQYLQNALGVQSQGLAGLSGLENQGFNASSMYGTGMANLAAEQAGLAEQAQQNTNNSWGSVFGGFANLFGL